MELSHCMNFRYHLTYNSRGAWHTVYAMLLLNYKGDGTTDLLPKRLWNYKIVFLVS